MERPDLTGLPAAVLAYIESLESQLHHSVHTHSVHVSTETQDEATLEPSEPPTSAHLITISAAGLAKRTPRHLYSRQRRGGMGIFDLDSPGNDPPTFLAMATPAEMLTLLTNHGRVFRVPVAEISERPVRSRGELLNTRLPLRPEERLALVLPEPPDNGTFLVLVTERGQVRRIARPYLGASLQAGSVLLEPREGGAPAAACWSCGSDELLIAARSGQAIRFNERLVPVRGCLGMRVDPDDRVVAVAAAPADGQVFLLGQDGKGTIRLLAGFTANKAPGAGGKTAMKADPLVGVVAVTEQSDLFVLSRLGKLIRFRANEVPPKEGVVQGVHCMSLRADECVALLALVP